jgi:hypothetical protein
MDDDKFIDVFTFQQIVSLKRKRDRIAADIEEAAKKKKLL